MEGPLRADPGDDLKIIETMLCEDGRFPRLDRHLARLGRTARRLGFPADMDRVHAVLAEAGGDGARRVRMTLDRRGKVEVTDAACVRVTPPWRLGIAETRLDSADPWLSVKTTRRALYDRTRQALPPEIDEIIFLNERGEVCEGTITNLFVELEGELCTPPFACGLLPGVLREELLETGQCRERVLFADDLAAGRLYCGNALRGLIPSVMAG